MVSVVHFWLVVNRCLCLSCISFFQRLYLFKKRVEYHIHTYVHGHTSVILKQLSMYASAFHLLCPTYSRTLTPTVLTAIRLRETFIQATSGETSQKSHENVIKIDKLHDLEMTNSSNYNFNGSNTFGTMKACSRQRQFDLMSVNHSARSGCIIGLSELERTYMY